MTSALFVAAAGRLMMTAASSPTGEAGGPIPVAEPVEGMGWAGLILWLPAIATVLCGV